MKKTLILIMLACAGVMNAQKPFKMEVIVEGEPDLKEVRIQLQKAGSLTEMEDEVKLEVKKGKAKYATKLTEIVQATVTRGEGEEEKVLSCYLVPDENLKLTIKGDEYFYGGSKLYQDCNECDIKITPTYTDLINYYQSAVARVQSLPDDQKETAAQKMNDTLRQKNDAYTNAIASYSASHKNVEGAMLYLLKYLNAEDEYNKMSQEMKDTRTGKYYKLIADYNAKIREDQLKRAAEEQAKLDEMKGKPAIDFTLNDLDGNPLTLSSLKGKFVVLDFWGSWCGWCIKGIPDMKKYYEKYAGKFEILGVDCNDTEKAWKDAVAKYELPWKHVYNPRDSKVLSDYNVQGFPTKIIIDPQGNLNKIIVGEDPAFYEYLDEILK